MAQGKYSKSKPLNAARAGNRRGTETANADGARPARFTRLYNPTPDEIRQRCAQIQSTWSRSERRRRREFVAPLNPREMPFLRIVYALRGI